MDMSTAIGSLDEQSLLLPVKNEPSSVLYKSKPYTSRCLLLLGTIAICLTCLIGFIQNHSSYAIEETSLASYGQSPPADVFHAELDRKTGLTGIYGMDSAGNYRLFARGEYLLNVSGSNWNYLNVENTQTHNDEDYNRAMRAVGFLEGFLTCQHMKEYYLNFLHDMFEGSLPSKQTQRFLRKNYEWTTKQANERYHKDDYWLAVKALLEQLDGMLSGFLESCPCIQNCDDTSLSSLNQPTILHLLLLNADGDLYQITEKYTEVARRRLQRKRSLLERAAIQEPMKNHSSPFDNHCSALIKLLPNNSDIMFGHDTWDSYESASPRSIKRFRLHTLTRSEILVDHWGEPIIGDLRHISNIGPELVTSATKESRWGSSELVISDVTFSSSPGFIASVDDFYITSGSYGSLMVTETSLDLYTPFLVEGIHPESVLFWIRATIANSLARNGPEWSWWFSLFHSGTYVNQWMVVDMNLFTPYSSSLEPNLLTVLEEMPGLVHSEDQTQHLEVV